MKHGIIAVLLAFLLLLAVGCASSSMTAEERKEASIKRYIESGYSLEDAEILAMSKQERREYLCPYYDIPVNMKDYKLRDSFYRSVIYSFVVGNYGAVIPTTDRETAESIYKNHADIVRQYEVTSWVLQRREFGSILRKEKQISQGMEL